MTADQDALEYELRLLLSEIEDRKKRIERLEGELLILTQTRRRLSAKAVRGIDDA